MADQSDDTATGDAGGTAHAAGRRPGGRTMGGTRAGQGWPEGLFRPVRYARSRDTYRPPPGLYRVLSRRLGPAAVSWGLAPEGVITVEVPGRCSGVVRRTTVVPLVVDQLAKLADLRDRGVITARGVRTREGQDHGLDEDRNRLIARASFEVVLRLGRTSECYIAARVVPVRIGSDWDNARDRSALDTTARC
jgi:hypothetical protein